MFYVQHNFSENRNVYEKMSKNFAEPEATNGNKIRRMRVACWITKPTLCVMPKSRGFDFP
jgi:hypothetical protein